MSQGCQRCGSTRLAGVSAKCDDKCDTWLVNEAHGGASSDYVPRDMGIGAGSYLSFRWCLECGQIQGSFPLPLTALEENEPVDD